MPNLALILCAATFAYSLATCPHSLCPHFVIYTQTGSQYMRRFQSMRSSDACAVVACLVCLAGSCEGITLTPSPSPASAKGLGACRAGCACMVGASGVRCLPTIEYLFSRAGVLGEWAANATARAELASLFSGAHPFPHVVIDNFFSPEAADRIERRFPVPNGTVADWKQQVPPSPPGCVPAVPVMIGCVPLCAGRAIPPSRGLFVAADGV